MKITKKLFFTDVPMAVPAVEPGFSLPDAQYCLTPPAAKNHLRCAPKKNLAGTQKAEKGDLSMKKRAWIVSLFLCVVMVAGIFGSGFLHTTADPAEFVYGDLNGNGVVDNDDAVYLSEYLTGWANRTANADTADFNHDGAVDQLDVAYLRRAVAGWEGYDLIRLEQNTYTIADMWDSMRVLGRAVRCSIDRSGSMTADADGTALGLDFSTAGMEFTFTGQGDVTLSVACGPTWYSSDGLFGVVIDHDFDNMQEVVLNNRDRTLEVAADLPYGQHTIRLVKINEYSSNGMQQSIAIKSVTLTGQLGGKPAEKALKLEFYGDSYTCGYGNLGRPSGPFGMDENAYKTYAAYCAQLLNADFSACAQSGYGLCYDYSGSSSGILESIWDKGLRSNTNTVWDFSGDAPDVVVINIGTNDVNCGKTITKAEIQQNATTLLDNIRSKYPDCKIVWICGLSGSGNNNTRAPFAQAIQELNYSDLTLVENLPCGKSGRDGHPLVSEHKAAGEKLAEIIQDLL